MKVLVIRQKHGVAKRFRYRKKSAPTSKLEMFWKVNRLELVSVEDFDLPVGDPRRVTVWFKGLWVRDGVFLHSVDASGKQRKRALWELAKRLSGKPLLVERRGGKRSEIEPQYLG